MLVKTISARNVNDALSTVLWGLRNYTSEEQPSRNGPVVKFPGPVVTAYVRPWERILWSKDRDANPFFHLMECIWMLAGRNDAESLIPFNSNMAKYSEDAGYFHGAYGFRWRHHFGFDQLIRVVKMLKEDPTSRRVVLQMWDPITDLGNDLSKDLPCNCSIFFEINAERQLNMTVCNRSNDIIWGAYGANVVHFSFLQQVIAELLGVEMGVYIQFSNNMHLYVDNEQAKRLLQYPPERDEDKYLKGELPYMAITDGHAVPYDLFNEMDIFMRGEDFMLENQFLREIAAPMRAFYLHRKRGHTEMKLLENMPHCDWKLAALDWVSRRNENGR